jgi:CubicO group peptidase (beta-lactamase class C family)
LKLADLEQAIARGEYPKTTSVLIMRNGDLAYEGYFGEGSQELLNNTRSATKFMTTLALGAAIGDHAIPSQQVRAFAYLSDLTPFQNDTPAKDAITLKDMLTMSSALDCDDNDDNSPGNEDNMHSQTNWTRWAVDLPTMQGYSRDASGLGPWRYCTTNAFLLGQIILVLRELSAAVVITRTAYNVHGSSLQTADMLKKYILPALPCARNSGYH